MSGVRRVVIDAFVATRGGWCSWMEKRGFGEFGGACVDFAKWREVAMRWMLGCVWFSLEPEA
jgi:hypothetical protein